MPKLTLMFEEKTVKEVPVGAKPVGIGRSPDNDLPVDNLAVSNYHARVYVEAGRLVVEDLDSLNGTFVNDMRVERATLSDGDSRHIGKHTPFFGLHAAGKLKTPDEATARALYDVTQEVCALYGLPAYEISNHARAGAECRHNLVYWRGEEYAGIGPGAHGRLDIDGTRHAIATEKRPEAWLMRVEASGHGVITDDPLNSEERADEFLLMGLRLAEGIDPARYAALSGRPLDPRGIARLREQGAISVDASGRLRVTQAGFPVLDAVVADLAA